MPSHPIGTAAGADDRQLSHSSHDSQGIRILPELVYQHVIRTNVDVQALVFVYHTLPQKRQMVPDKPFAGD